MIERPDKPRLIDMLRDGGGSMEIQTLDDKGPITDIISTDERLFVVKGKGIYEVKLADQVDPNRTNITTPNTIQRVLPYGSDDAWIGATILTAHRLFKGTKAQDKVDGDEAFTLVIEIAEDISGAYLFYDAFSKAVSDAIANLDSKIRPDRSIIVPAIGNVETKCNEFLQRVDHALRELFRLVKMFYTDVGAGGWDSLKKKIDGEPQDTDNFPQVMAEILPFLQLIRNARNCVEHPRPEQRLIVIDFSLDPKNTLVPPTIQIVHPKSPHEETPVSMFFSQALQYVVDIVELMIVFLCARHVKPVAGMPIRVMEIPPEKRKSPHVRYGYGALLGGQLVPFS